jgi:hypothetical protein
MCIDLIRRSYQYGNVQEAQQFSDHMCGLFSFQRITQYCIQFPNPRTSDSTALLLVTAGAFLTSGHGSYVSEACVLPTKSDFPITPLPQ